MSLESFDAQIKILINEATIWAELLLNSKWLLHPLHKLFGTTEYETGSSLSVPIERQYPARVFIKYSVLNILQ